MTNVKASSLASVFTDSTFSTFTSNTKNKGVTDNCVIYITCDENDADIFGETYIAGSHWIWAKGEMFSGNSSTGEQGSGGEYTGDGIVIVNNNDHTIKHISNLSAESAGESSNKTLGFSGSFKIPQISRNKYGHVSSLNERTITLPESPSFVTEASADINTEGWYRIGYFKDERFYQGDSGLLNVTFIGGGNWAESYIFSISKSGIVAPSKSINNNQFSITQLSGVTGGWHKITKLGVKKTYVSSAWRWEIYFYYTHGGNTGQSSNINVGFSSGKYFVCETPTLVSNLNDSDFLKILNTKHEKLVGEGLVAIDGGEDNQVWNTKGGKTTLFSGSYDDLDDTPTITDEKVTQENSTSNSDYRVLLSNSANDTTETKTSRKSSKLKFNPSTGKLTTTTLTSTVSNGTAPLSVTSKTQVNNLKSEFANKSDNLAGGSEGSIPYQTKEDNTEFIPVGKDGQVLKIVNGIPTWGSLPDTMEFKGTVGSKNATITDLPIDGKAEIGDTYKVITDGKYAGEEAFVGDTFICDSKTSDKNTWVRIPSGDEPSGTVTSITIKANSPISIDSSSAITSSGTRTISHKTSGVTSGSYGLSTTKTLGHSDTFNIPYITIDTYGHITSASTKTITLPSDSDEKVKLTKTSPSGYSYYRPLLIYGGTGVSGTPTADSFADYTGNSFLFYNLFTLPSTGSLFCTNLGSSSIPITNSYLTNINGVAVGNSPKFTDTDTKCTAVGNHYTPLANRSAELTATLSGTAGSFEPETEYIVLTGVKAQRDAKGHVTGLTYTALNILDTDEKVKQSLVTINDTKSLPLLLAYNYNPDGECGEVKYTTNFSYNPSLASFCLGLRNSAEGTRSRAFGAYSSASGQDATAIGYSVKASSKNQFVIGTYNVEDTSNTYLFIIGNGTPSVNKNALTVDSNNNLFVTNNITAGNNLIAINDVSSATMHTTNGFFLTSDINKKNVLGDLDLNKAYSLIDKCQTIIYTLKEDKSKKEEIGLIAQEVQEFFPEIINKDKEGILSLDYAKLSVVILRVLKDLINRVSILENKN